jgi:hypothetical protein
LQKWRDRYPHATVDDRHFGPEEFVGGSTSVTDDNWSGVRGQNIIKREQPCEAMPIHQQTAQEAYESMLKHAGAASRIAMQLMSGSSKKSAMARQLMKESTSP